MEGDIFPWSTNYQFSAGDFIERIAHLRRVHAKKLNEIEQLYFQQAHDGSERKEPEAFQSHKRSIEVNYPKNAFIKWSSNEPSPNITPDIEEDVAEVITYDSHMDDLPKPTESWKNKVM